MVKNVIIKSGNHSIDLHTNGIDHPKKIIVCLHGFNGDLWGDGFSKLKNAFDNILVCSFDSAGHANSEVKSIDMRLDLINQELIDVLNYLTEVYPVTPITLLGFSYGGYRAMLCVAKNDFKNLKQLVLVNPALNMLKTIEIAKGFKYANLKPDSKIAMKESLNKYLCKDFIDDLYYNNLYKLKYEHKIPLKIFKGKYDSLISIADTFEFAKTYPFDIEYLEEDHLVKKPESWQKITKFLKQ